MTTSPANIFFILNIRSPFSESGRTICSTQFLLNVVRTLTTIQHSIKTISRFRVKLVIDLQLIRVESYEKHP